MVKIIFIFKIPVSQALHYTGLRTVEELMFFFKCGPECGPMLTKTGYCDNLPFRKLRPQPQFMDEWTQSTNPSAPHHKNIMHLQLSCYTERLAKNFNVVAIYFQIAQFTLRSYLHTRAQTVGSPHGYELLQQICYTFIQCDNRCAVVKTQASKKKKTRLVKKT